MSRKRFVSCMVCLSVGLTLGLGLGWAATAQASKRFHLIGGGGQIAIGRGLPLPPQNLTSNMTKTNFPPLLVPAAISEVIRCTTEMAIQKNCCLPKSLLHLDPAQRTHGVYTPSNVLYAVGTNLGWRWPAAPAVISTGARTGNTTTTFSPPVGAGASIRYSNAKGRKFGGPARFSISYGQQPQGRINNSPVTIYAIAVRPTGNPPCTHPAFNGTDSMCVAILGGMWPSTQWVIGGPVSVSGKTTPQGAPKPGVGVGEFGPNGTVLLFAWTGGNASGFSNQATSYGYPWTTGMLTIKMTGVGETFTITGMDNRTTGGSGTIQLVAGSLSTRVVSGPNANRGWVRLELVRRPDEAPSMSPAGLVATAGLMLLAVGYALRRRFSR